MAKFTVSTIFRAMDHMSGPMSRMQKNANRAMKGISGGVRFLKTAAIGIASVLATGAVGKAINDFQKTGDEIAKTARMLGLGAEALQELRFAADREGISSEALNTGFRLMNKNIGDLKAGQGELYSRLKITNPALAKQLRNVQGTEEGFTLLIDAISKEGDVTKRAALAQAAFGRSGQELIKLAIGGTKGLEDLREEARKYGGILSNEAAAAAERFNDSMTNMKAALTGIKNVALGGLITQLQPLIQGFAEWLALNKQLIGANFGRIFSVLGNVSQQLGPIVLRVLDKMLPALAKIVDALLPVLVQLLEALLPILDPLLALLEPLLEIFIALSPALIAIADLIKAVLVPALELLRPLLELIAAILEPVAKGIAWVAKGAGKLLGGALGNLSQRINGGPQSAASGLAEGMSSVKREVSRTMVDVNLNNLPAGTSVKQRGQAPGFTLNTGFAFATGQGQGGLW